MNIRKSLHWHLRNAMNALSVSAGGRMVRSDGTQVSGGYEGRAETRERERRQAYVEQHRHLY